RNGSRSAPYSGRLVTTRAMPVPRTSRTTSNTMCLFPTPEQSALLDATVAIASAGAATSALQSSAASAGRAGASIVTGAASEIATAASTGRAGGGVGGGLGAGGAAQLPASTTRKRLTMS